ncbi:MAG: hypothetical protein DWQ01_14965 [Planctomycetota bacterium]|nr:MAG: hypothetical protein DWQ01_14965 [Planctomycetota bacterium]
MEGAGGKLGEASEMALNGVKSLERSRKNVAGRSRRPRAPAWVGLGSAWIRWWCDLVAPVLGRDSLAHRGEEIVAGPGRGGADQVPGRLHARVFGQGPWFRAKNFSSIVRAPLFATSFFSWLESFLSFPCFP